MTLEDKEYLEKSSLKDFDLQQKVKDTVQSEIDKIVFYLSTGTFVISISFIGYLKNKPILPCLLISAWICFTLVIGVQILVHILSKKVADKKQTHINSSRALGFLYSWQTSIEEDINIKKMICYANKLDILGFIVLMIGLICLLTFASINLLSLK